MKKHIMISLDENDIIKLRAISNLKGLNVSQYITLLTKTAVVYHDLNNGQPDAALKTKCGLKNIKKKTE